MDLPKKGVLSELIRKGLSKKWEDRYFDLTNGVLRSFASEANQELKLASVALDGAQVFRPPASENDREFAINILPAREEHMYTVACISEEECKEWLAALAAHSKSIVVFQGPLMKCDSGFKKWNQRHFILTKKALMYFKSPEAKLPQAEIDLQAGGDIIPEADVKGYRYAFSITPKDLDKAGKRRTYVLVAASEKEREAWIAAFRSILPTSVSRFSPSTPDSVNRAVSVGAPSSEYPSFSSSSSAPNLASSATLAISTSDSPAFSRLNSSPTPSPPASPAASPSSSFPGTAASPPSPTPSPRTKTRSNSIVMFATNIATRLTAKSTANKTLNTKKDLLPPAPMPAPPPPTPLVTVVGFDSSDEEEPPETTTTRKRNDLGPPPKVEKEFGLLSPELGVIAQGILEKRSPTKSLLGMHIWKHRLLTLERDSKGVQIKYYKPEQPLRPLGVIPHKLVLRVDILDAELQRFDIVTQKRTFHLRGIEEGDLDMWVGWLKQLQITSSSKTMTVTERSAEEANEYKARRVSHMPTHILHEGFLAKKSPKGIGMWQKRYFVLTEARLAYYKTQDTSIAPLGMILLNTLEQVTVLHQDEGMFCLEYGAGRRMVLMIVKPSAVDRVVEGGWNASQKLEEQLNLWLNAFTKARSITVKKENPENPQPMEEVVFEEEYEDDPVYKSDMVRFRVAQELLTTERSYIKQLECALEVYMQPMAEVGLLNDRTKAILFSNLPTILPLNRIFLESVENRVQASVWKHNPKIGDIFLEFAPFFKLYSEYARSNQAASELLGQFLSTNSKFLKYHDTQIGSEKPSLASLLITPIQRVPRYQLLLKEILKNTPSDHADREDCEKALAAVTTVAALVNTCIKERELADLAVSLESKFTTSPGFVDPSRIFIMQGPLTKYSRNDQPSLYEFFLFNDMLAYASLRADGKFKLKHKLQINEAFGVDSGLPTELTFSVKSQEKTFKVSAPDEAKKRNWVRALEECANGIKAKKRPDGGAAKVRPLWRNNEDCRCCRKKFNLLLHRYHCASCGWSVCAKCSPHRQNDERCCNRCVVGQPTEAPLEGFGSEDVASRTGSVVDESDDDVLSEYEEEAGWVNPFAVFAARTEDLEEKGQLSVTPGGLDLPPDLKRSKSKERLASTPKKPGEKADKAEKVMKAISEKAIPEKEPAAPIVASPTSMSLTFFAYTNAPTTFQNAQGASLGSARAEVAALSHSSSNSCGNGVHSSPATSSNASSATSIPSSNSSSATSSSSSVPSSSKSPPGTLLPHQLSHSPSLAEISIQLPPSTLAEDYPALPPPPAPALPSNLGAASSSNPSSNSSTAASFVTSSNSSSATSSNPSSNPSSSSSSVPSSSESPGTLFPQELSHSPLLTEISIQLPPSALAEDYTALPPPPPPALPSNLGAASSSNSSSTASNPSSNASSATSIPSSSSSSASSNASSATSIPSSNSSSATPSSSSSVPSSSKSPPGTLLPHQLSHSPSLAEISIQLPPSTLAEDYTALPPPPALAVSLSTTQETFLPVARPL